MHWGMRHKEVYGAYGFQAAIEGGLELAKRILVWYLTSNNDTPGEQSPPKIWWSLYAITQEVTQPYAVNTG